MTLIEACPGPVIHLASVTSTQDVARELVEDHKPVGVVIADEQTSGRGRLGRKWLTGPGDSLTASFVFNRFPPLEPFLVGMKMAVIAAGVVSAALQWPNDIILNNRKVGGVLGEVVGASLIIGLGINLHQQQFPTEIAERATSITLERSCAPTAEHLLDKILERMESEPMPQGWADIQVAWGLRDATPGKQYRLADGRIVTAVWVTDKGELMCRTDTGMITVTSADALRY